MKRSHSLRYTLKNRKTDEVLFCVVFTLYLKEDVDEKGNVKDGVEGGKPYVGNAEEEKRHEKAKTGGEEVEEGETGKENVKVGGGGAETSADDVD